MSDKIKRVTDPADPNRCQGNGPTGQCMNLAMEGSDYCAAHGGNKGQESSEKERLRNYKLKCAAIRRNMIEKSHSTGIKSLRDEIALARTVLEEVLNKCDTAVDLILSQNQIQQWIAQIDKLVTSCHKLETSLGMTLDRAAILKLGTAFIDAMTEGVNSCTELNEQGKTALLTSLSDSIFDIIKDVGCDAS